jgi:hypothetical protein
MRDISEQLPEELASMTQGMSRPGLRYVLSPASALARADNVLRCSADSFQTTLGNVICTVRKSARRHR